MTRASRWGSLLAVLLVLGGASGCPDPTTPCFGGPQSPPTSQRVFGVSEEVVLQVNATLVGECDSEEPPRQPESATVEVYDPENRPVPATASLGLGGATVRFRPSQAGRHHVLVAFVPVGSLHQRDVLVVEDRRGETPLVSFPAGTGCAYVDRTAQGTWLCGTRALREPAGPPQWLSTSFEPTLAVSGDVVWTLEEDRVLRYVDPGTGPLELTGAARAPAAPTGSPSVAGPDPRLATPEEFLLTRGGVLFRYTFTASGGVVEAPPSILRSLDGSAIPSSDSLSALLLRAGPRLLVVGNGGEPRSPEPRLKACPYQLDARGTYAPVLDAPCQVVQGELVGYEQDVLWTLTSDFSSGVVRETLHRYSASRGRLEEAGVLALNGALVVQRPPLRPGPTLPLLATPGSFRPFTLPRWNAVMGLLELELAPDPGSTLGLPRFGERFLWVESQGATGGVRVYARSSTR
jgi:hypothetical protein